MEPETGDSSPLMEALTHYSREREAAAAKARKQLGVNELDAKALAIVGATPGMRPSELAATLGSRAAVLELPEGVKDLSELAQRPNGRQTFFELLRQLGARKEANHATSL